MAATATARVRETRRGAADTASAERRRAAPGVVDGGGWLVASTTVPCRGQRLGVLLGEARRQRQAEQRDHVAQGITAPGPGAGQLPGQGRAVGGGHQQGEVGRGERGIPGVEPPDGAGLPGEQAHPLPRFQTCSSSATASRCEHGRRQGARLVDDPVHAHRPEPRQHPHPAGSGPDDANRRPRQHHRTGDRLRVTRDDDDDDPSGHTVSAVVATTASR